MENPIEPIVPGQAPVAQPDKQGEMVPKSQLDAVVSELKELRAKSVQAGVPTVDVDKKIAEAIQARDRQEADKNWEKAQVAFIAKHKEYHPDNDTGGLKKSILDRELSLLNRNGLTSVEDLEAILEKANTLAVASSSSPVQSVRIDPSIPRSNPEPKAQDGSKLTPKELRVLEQLQNLGASSTPWTEERFLKLKAKDPGFVERALVQAQ